MTSASTGSEREIEKSRPPSGGPTRPVTPCRPKRIDDPDDGVRSWVNDFGLHLSGDELKEFLDEQWEFIMRWMRRSRELSQSGDGVERHTYYSMMFGAPLDEVLGLDGAADQRGPADD